MTRLTQAQSILEYLKDHTEGAYVYELIAPQPHGLGIAQYNARIYELRRKGYDIRSDRAGHFVLHREPTQLNVYSFL